MARSRAAVLAVAVTVLAVLAGLGGVTGYLLFGRTAERSGVVGAGSAAAKVRSAAGTAGAPLVLQKAARPGAPVVLFIGASYTAGLGAHPATDGYAYRTAAALGWSAEVDGSPGTGFVNPGPLHAGTYASRITQLRPPWAPQLVVVQTGRNDLPYPSQQVSSAASSTLALVHARWPHARLAVLGPIPASAPTSAALQRLDETFAAVARTAGATYVDAIAQHWVTPANQRTLAGPVPLHPGDSGYAYLAQRLAPQLAPLIPG